MGYFERHPLVFRLLLVAMSLYMVGLGLTALFYTTSTSTDENTFTTPPSPLYITRSFPAEQQYSSGISIPRQLRPDSVYSGMMLLAIDNQDVISLEQVQTLLRERSSTRYIAMQVFSLVENTAKTYHVQREHIPQNFVREIPPTAHVISVEPGGVSDQAGMKVGDLIISINGKRFSDIQEADRIMRQSQANLAIKYEVLRNNSTLTLTLTLSRVRFPLPLLIIFLCGLIYIGFGLFLGLQRPQLAAARLLSLAFICVGFIWLVWSHTSLAMPIIINILRFLTFLLAAFFGTAFWFHSTLHFPIEQPPLLQKRWIYRTTYILAAVFAAHSIALGLLNSYNDSFLMIGMFIMFTYMAIVSKVYRKQFSAEYKRIVRPIRITVILAPVLTASVMLLLILIPSFRTAWTVVFATLFMCNIPLIYLYVIGRYKLLGLHVRVRRTIQYNVLSSVWKISLLIIAIASLYTLTQFHFDVPNIRFTGMAVEIPKEPISFAEQMVLEKIILMAAAICCTLAFWKIGRAGQNYINRAYYRSEYDYRQAATDFADVIATRLTADDLAEGIAQKTVESVHLKQAGMIVVYNGKTLSYKEWTAAEQHDNDAPPVTPIADTEALLRALPDFQGGVSVEYLPKTLKEQLRTAGYSHLIPIRSKNTLLGVIAIGEKLSEAGIEREDLAFLESVARQAAVAIENAFLYDELAQQERLKHELAIARKIQLASLPQTTPDIQGLDIAGMSCPAQEVGGDYFDYLNGSPGSITVIVGDVSGKGTSAALYMSKVQGILRSLHAFDLSPRDLLVRTNHLLHADLEKQSYVTVLSACFNTATTTLSLARAGHLPLLHFSAQTRTITPLSPRGIGLGIVNNTFFSTRIDELNIPYSPGDIFLFITDGITEAMNSLRQEFGDERLHALLLRCIDKNADTIRDTICQAVEQFTGSAALHDDFTVVVVKAV